MSLISAFGRILYWHTYRFKKFTLQCTMCNNFFALMFCKGTVQRDFWPQFFSSFEPAWVTDQRVKIFSILVEISLGYLNFFIYHTAQSQSPRGTQSYCAESISPWYSIILRRVNLPAVLNHTGQSQSPRSMILRWVTHDPSHFLTLLHRPLKGQCQKN